MHTPPPPSPGENEYFPLTCLFVIYIMYIDRPSFLLHPNLWSNIGGEGGELSGLMFHFTIYLFFVFLVFYIQDVDQTVQFVTGQGASKMNLLDFFSCGGLNWKLWYTVYGIIIYQMWQCKQIDRQINKPIHIDLTMICETWKTPNSEDTHIDCCVLLFKWVKYPFWDKLVNKKYLNFLYCIHSYQIKSIIETKKKTLDKIII